jgi:hypothetical protein
MLEKTKKISISLSVNKDLDDLFEKVSKKIIEVDGTKVVFTKSKTDIYNRALEYAVENINEWLK